MSAFPYSTTTAPFCCSNAPSYFHSQGLWCCLFQIALFRFSSDWLFSVLCWVSVQISPQRRLLWPPHPKYQPPVPCPFPHPCPTMLNDIISSIAPTWFAITFLFVYLEVFNLFLCFNLLRCKLHLRQILSVFSLLYHQHPALSVLHILKTIWMTKLMTNEWIHEWV